MDHNESSRGRKLVYLVIALMAAGISLLPVIWLVFTSFKDHNEIFASTPTLVPHHFTAIQYINLFVNDDYAQYIWNSIVISAITTVVVLLLGILSGFGYSKFFSFRGKNTMFLFVLISRMLPPIAIVVPLYVLFAALGLLNTRIGLVFINSAIALPLAIWMLTTFFDDIPKSLIDAARIDGCNSLGILWYVIIPLSKSAIASTVTITFLTAWNLFLIPLIFGKSDSTQLLPVAISKLAYGEYGTAWGGLAALSVAMIVPVALIGLFGQRYLASGLTAGAEKG